MHVPELMETAGRPERFVRLRGENVEDAFGAHPVALVDVADRGQRVGVDAGDGVVLLVAEQTRFGLLVQQPAVGGRVGTGARDARSTDAAQGGQDRQQRACDKPSGYSAVAFSDSVCRASGLSSATVSRVINRSALVRRETRERVLLAMRELDYQPSHAAQTLAKRRTDTLGVLYPHMASGFFADILQGIDEVAAEADYQVLTLFTHRKLDGQDRIASFTARGRVDGLILLNLDFPDAMVRSIANCGVPTVLLDRPVPGSGMATVEIDNAAGADALMTHMLEHGYRDVLVLGGPRNSFDGDARWRGCLRAARRFGVPLAAGQRLRGDFREDAGAAAMAQWLDEGHPLPRAIVALNDVMARRLYDRIDWPWMLT